MSEIEESDECKVCGNTIFGKAVLMHGRFPMHGDCYEEVIQA